MEIGGKRVLVTGGGGFLGRHIVNRLDQKGAQVFAPRKLEYDLTQVDATERMFQASRPEVVVHAAGDLGGIEYNRVYPADIFRNNLQMTTNILELSHLAQVSKLVIINSACAYPGSVSGPLKEEELLNGAMHPSVAYYGLSKRALYLGARAYHEQYGLRSVSLLLTNLYGPEDKFGEEGHVIPSLTRRFVEAVEHEHEEVVCWGTGNPVREFLYVEDCADAVVRAIEVYDDIEPLNIGEGTGTTIRDLAQIISEVSGFKGRIVWDTTKPDGAMYKVVDTSKMRAVLNWEPRMSLREGITRVVQWFRNHRNGSGSTPAGHTE